LLQASKHIPSTLQPAIKTFEKAWKWRGAWRPKDWSVTSRLWPR
jgi:hypothetical protein